MNQSVFKALKECVREKKMLEKIVLEMQKENDDLRGQIDAYQYMLSLKKDG